MRTGRSGEVPRRLRLITWKFRGSHSARVGRANVRQRSRGIELSDPRARRRFRSDRSVRCKYALSDFLGALLRRLLRTQARPLACRGPRDRLSLRGKKPLSPCRRWVFCNSGPRRWSAKAWIRNALPRRRFILGKRFSLTSGSINYARRRGSSGRMDRRWPLFLEPR